MKKEWLFFYICLSVSLCTELSTYFFPGLYSLVLLSNAVIPVLLYTSSGTFLCLSMKDNPDKTPSFRLVVYGSTDSNIKETAMRTRWLF